MTFNMCFVPPLLLEGGGLWAALWTSSWCVVAGNCPLGRTMDFQHMCFVLLLLLFLAGRCPVGPTVDVHLVTSGLNFNIFTTFNPFSRDIPQNIGGSLNPTASSFSTTQFFSSSVYGDLAANSNLQGLMYSGFQQQSTGSNLFTQLNYSPGFFLNRFPGDLGRRLQTSDNSSSSSNSSISVAVQVVESVDGAAWRGVGSLQPKALGPLQQLLADLIRLGVPGVLPGFSSSLGRLAGLSIDEAGGFGF